MENPNCISAKKRHRPYCNTRKMKICVVPHIRGQNPFLVPSPLLLTFSPFKPILLASYLPDFDFQWDPHRSENGINIWEGNLYECLFNDDGLITEITKISNGNMASHHLKIYYLNMDIVRSITQSCSTGGVAKYDYASANECISDMQEDKWLVSVTSYCIKRSWDDSRSYEVIFYDKHDNILLHNHYHYQEGFGYERWAIFNGWDFLYDRRKRLVYRFLRDGDHGDNTYSSTEYRYSFRKIHIWSEGVYSHDDRVKIILNSKSRPKLISRSWSHDKYEESIEYDSRQRIKSITTLRYSLYFGDPRLVSGYTFYYEYDY